MDLESMNVVTKLFEHREVKPHFINPNCFGEDFAAWLRSKIADLRAEGFELSVRRSPDSEPGSGRCSVPLQGFGC